jgi:hypothetical protein
MVVEARDPVDPTGRNATCSHIGRYFFWIKSFRIGVLDRYGLRDGRGGCQLLWPRMRGAWGALPRDFATLAPAIVEYANDLIAVELLRLAGWHIDALAQRLLALGVDRLSLAGSLSASIEPCLAEGTRRHLVAPLGDAVAGALQLARDAAELVSDRAVSRRP